MRLLLRTSTHGYTSVGWSTKIYIDQLCMKTGCSLGNMAGMMDNREG